MGENKLRKGLKIGITLAVLVPALATGMAWSMARAGYTLTANLTPSIPVGLYLANANHRDAIRGELVAFGPHNEAAREAFKRGWMKLGSRFVKRVGAIAGDVVCADVELTIRTAGQGETPTFVRVGKIAASDRRGVPLPRALKGCVVVPVGHFLPVGDGRLNSYDGRYYGFVPVASIEARLRPMWTQNKEGN